MLLLLSVEQTDITSAVHLAKQYGINCASQYATVVLHSRGYSTCLHYADSAHAIHLEAQCHQQPVNNSPSFAFKIAHWQVYTTKCTQNSELSCQRPQTNLARRTA